MRGVGWDASHGEFLVEDYYYLSKLGKLLREKGIKVNQVEDFDELEEYDVIVFNYPEEEFEKKEVERIEKWLSKGKRIIFAAYYQDMDKTATNINKVLSELKIPLRINNDVVIDSKNNLGDEMFPLCKYNGYTVVMPCTSSLIVADGNALILSTGITKPKKRKNPVVGAMYKNGGELVVLGTCVFWDNYSLDLVDNKILAFDLLTGKRIK